MKRKLADFGNLSVAEADLRNRLGTGGDDSGVVIINRDRPDADAGPDHCIRGDFIRYLMLGGCDALPHPVLETGVRVFGARITGKINLEGANCPRDLGLYNCHIDTAPLLRSARIGNVNFHGSHIPGLNADGLCTQGGVLLRNCTSTGEIRLVGAQIGGNLSCTGAELTAGEGGKVLIADRLCTQGDVLLRNCTSTGEIRLLGAQIGGDLDCEGATLTAGEGGKVLNADGASIKGAFFLREGAQIKGILDLTDAEIGNICDVKDCWPDHKNLLLNRCQYGAFTGHNVNARDRIKWLNLLDSEQFDKPFWPQPWEHCAKVLREMGHAGDARAVLIDKEKNQRRDRRRRMTGWATVLRPFAWLKDMALNITIRYGHQPLLAFFWLILFSITGFVVFDNAAQNHAIKPNNAFVLRSSEWAQCAQKYTEAAEQGKNATQAARRFDPHEHRSQLSCYQDQPEAQSYPHFNAFIYSIDTLLPIVDLEMQGFWIPDDRVMPWARWYLWFHIAMGWALSLLAVAGFSGLIKGRS